MCVNSVRHYWPSVTIFRFKGFTERTSLINPIEASMADSSAALPIDRYVHRRSVDGVRVLWPPGANATRAQIASFEYRSMFYGV